MFQTAASILYTYLLVYNQRQNAVFIRTAKIQIRFADEQAGRTCHFKDFAMFWLY